MATIANTIKKAEKVTGNKVRKDDYNQYFVAYKGYTISWACNGHFSPDAEAICFYATKRERTADDHATDYFPGFFRDNLSQLVKSVDRLTATA